MGARIGLEEKCARNHQQIFSLQSRVQNLETMNKQLTIASEQMIEEFEGKKKELYEQLQKMEQYREQAEISLSWSTKRIEELQRSVEDFKMEIEQLVQKEMGNKRSIGDLQVRICQLTEELVDAKKQICEMKSYSMQIQELSNRMMGCGSG